MLELWQEMADRFAAVDSEKAFHMACRLAGLGLREMIEAGSLKDDVSQQLLNSSDSPNPSLADFSLRAAWYAFADRVVRDATVLELEMVDGNSFFGTSDFARDWPIIKESYRTVCAIMARQARPQDPELDPLFALYNRMKKAAGKRHKEVTDAHVAEAHFDSLGKAEQSKRFANRETRETVVAEFVTKLRNGRKNHPERLWSPGN